MPSFEDYHIMELEKEMRRLLADNMTREAMAINQRGLWTDPPRQRFGSRSKKVSRQERSLLQAVFTRSYVAGRELQRWGYKCDGR